MTNSLVTRSRFQTLASFRPARWKTRIPARRATAESQATFSANAANTFTAIAPPRLASFATVRYRSIWISDIHLGTVGCQATRLLDFLRRTESTYLYLVGDIIDGW